jgi:hypothetical protein
MDKKKKPPPGATLIQRLREAKLRREQAESATRSEGADTPSSKQEQASKGASQADARVVSQTARQQGQQSGSARKTPPAKKEQAQLEFEPAGEGKEAVKEAAAHPEQAPGSPAIVSPPAEIVSVQADLIHRSISIDDLRPHSDSYDQLTEEIRLAGRFAAAGLIAQGLRLARLKDDAIYKDHYSSFEDYCRTEHSMSATYAYRLIRMAEMAERIAEEGHKSLASSPDLQAMPDPFEVMLGLGHRHIMALLPLETETAGELLVRGVPLTDQGGNSSERIPIARATEQQIKEAISLFIGAEVKKAVRGALRQAPPAVPQSRSVRTLSDIIDLLQEWADWLDSEPQPKYIADRIGEGKEIGKLESQLRKMSERIAETLHNLPRSKK